MKCQCCDKKIREIKEDKYFMDWERKYHKKCWNNRLPYLQMREDLKRKNMPVPEFIEKLACIK